MGPAFTRGRRRRCNVWMVHQEKGDTKRRSGVEATLESKGEKKRKRKKVLLG